MSSRRHLIYLTNYVGPRVARRRGITTHSEAANRRVESLARALQDAGYTVQLISAGWKRSAGTWRRYPVATEHLSDHLVCRYLPYFDFPPLNALVCVCSTLRLILSLHRRYPHSAVVFYNPTVQSALPALLARCLCRLPLFIQLEDGTHLIRSLGWLRTAAFRFLLAGTRPLVTGAIVPSRQLAAYYEHKPVFLFRGCVRGDDAVPGDQPPPTDTLNFLFGGTLDDIRGVDILIAALKILETTAPPGSRRPKFQITGSGPREDWLRDRCREFKFLEVRYLGRLSALEYGKVLADSHVGLALQNRQHPFSRACFPSKVISLIAAGKLVITSAVADLEDFLAGKVLVYRDDDPHHLADTILEVCRQPEKYLALAGQTRRWFACRYSAEKAAEALRRLIG